MNGCWNPWHGCKKYSEGCLHCYMYRRDESIGKNPAVISKTGDYLLPLKKSRAGEYKIPDGSTVFTCMTSDFFLEEADIWRPDAWRAIKERPNVTFRIITKRIARFEQCLPPDWGSGYENVGIICTVENQKQCDLRLSAFLSAPICWKAIGCEPMLSQIDLEKYLDDSIRLVLCGGESGPEARECRFEWVLNLREQCFRQKIPFYFKQTGANFVKNGKRYHIERRLQGSQARKAGLDLHF